MDPVLKARWLEALRSGRYKKTCGELHTAATDGYCCLGVLADMEGLMIIDEDVRPEKGILVPEADREDGNMRYGYLPQHIAAAYKLDGLVDGIFNVQEKLSEINDRSETFDNVIDYIEKML